jgi:hypothetical protein
MHNKISNKLVKHIELIPDHNVLKHSLLQHDRQRVHRTLQDSKSENTTIQLGYITVTLHTSILLSYLSQPS